MASLNTGRIVLGAIAGTVVWVGWSTIINLKVLGPRYAAGQETGTFLKQPRYSFSPVGWILTLLVLSLIIAWLYASVRGAWGAGPGSALLVGLVVGFASGFPMNFSLAAWAPFSRAFPLWWMLDLWVGAILAALIAGWLYREPRV